MVSRAMIALVVGVSLCLGCGIKVNGGLDPTLHFHSSLAEMSKPPVQTHIQPPKQFATRLLVEPVARYYPLPLGLHYNSGGASRKLRSQYTGAWVSGGTPERRLTSTLRRVLLPGQGDMVVLTSALVALELYTLGGHIYSAAALEVRAVRKGTEVYTARYHARAQRVGMMGGLDAVWPALETQLVGQLQADRRLYAALEGRR